MGKALADEMISRGYSVWGVARRRVEKRGFFNCSNLDMSKSDSWNLLIQQMSSKKFRPNIIIFMLAIMENDLHPNINIKITDKVMRTNFYSILWGVEALLPYASPKAQYIAISSSSGLKGNAYEGIGYPASKAALSMAFESLYQKYQNTKLKFTTVYFGPIETPMRRLKSSPPITLTVEKAVEVIMKAVKEKRGFYYAPYFLFLGLKLMKAFLPLEVVLRIFSYIERRYNR